MGQEDWSILEPASSFARQTGFGNLRSHDEIFFLRDVNDSGLCRKVQGKLESGVTWKKCSFFPPMLILSVLCLLFVNIALFTGSSIS